MVDIELLQLLSTLVLKNRHTAGALSTCFPLATRNRKGVAVLYRLLRYSGERVLHSVQSLCLVDVQGL